MVQNYSALLKQIRNMRTNYPNLSIDDKLKLLQIELRIESKRLKERDCHTKNEKKKMKTKVNEIRKHNEKNHVLNK